MALLLYSLPACKKCYTCTNECTRCTITVGNNSFSETFCKDTFANAAAYNARISADTAAGYVCALTSPSYTYEYCANKPGDEQYLNYFSKSNRVTCNEK